jgi:hypothetical protein
VNKLINQPHSAKFSVSVKGRKLAKLTLFRTCLGVFRVGVKNVSTVASEVMDLSAFTYAGSFGATLHRGHISLQPRSRCTSLGELVEEVTPRRHHSIMSILLSCVLQIAK